MDKNVKLAWADTEQLDLKMLISFMLNSLSKKTKQIVDYVAAN